MGFCSYSMKNPVALYGDDRYPNKINKPVDIDWQFPVLGLGSRFDTLQLPLSKLPFKESTRGSTGNHDQFMLDDFFQLCEFRLEACLRSRVYHLVKNPIATVSNRCSQIICHQPAKLSSCVMCTGNWQAMCDILE